MQADDRVTILHGDCRKVLADIPSESIDAVVTDPPYGLEFMGKDWDAPWKAEGLPLPTQGFQRWFETVAVELLRVLKPGGHLLAFGGTRTYHRLACAIEDAGFEVRDSIHWVYGSGFPKSLDVSKAIDKMDAAEEQRARRLRFTAWVRSTGVTARQIDEATGTMMGGHYLTNASQPAVMTREHLEACRHLLGNVPQWVEQECDKRSVESRNFAAREVVGTRSLLDATLVRPGFAGDRYNEEGVGSIKDVPITTPATDAARQWEGWGTALKPAHEPIVVARKPLRGTVAANVLEFGTGALNIDGCRVGAINAGRWPANIVHDGSPDVLERFPITAPSKATAGRQTPSRGTVAYGVYSGTDKVAGHDDAGGSAARFFTSAEWHDDDAASFYYCAKAPARERNAGLQTLPEVEVHHYGAGLGEGLDPDAPASDRNHHPTVKPLALMRWLVRLVTPPDGIVLDPFTGSGTTLVAAVLEGKRAVGVEMTDEYLPIIRGRVAWAQAQADGKLFHAG